METEDVSKEENKTEKRKDPTEAELKEYFKQIDQKNKSILIKKGAKEYSYDDGFSCICRDQKNADRKHQNWINK
jgi:hypothetical protein